MKISELSDCPAWLRSANTVDADVTIDNGVVFWWGGEFRGGVFSGGEFRGGVFRGGEFRGGVFSGGEFRGGVFRGGEFRGGEFSGGEFRGGEFRGGEFRGGVFSGGVFSGGEWLDKRTDRLIFMAAMIGIIFDADGYGIAYRTTNGNGRGRHNREFVQREGEYFEDDLPKAGSGTCVKGIHVSSAAIAWTYFGIDTTAQLWRVRVHRDDILDCDGQKARIRGGTFTKIECPFLIKQESKATI